MVTIISLFGGTSSLLEDGGEGGQGSGFVLDGEGYIATNAHVVTSDDGGRADNVFVEFSDGNRVPAKIVGVDPNADVALLKVDPKGLSLTPLRLGVSHTITVGEPVAAIGSPFGERQSLSIGVISAVDRNIASLTDFQIGDAIQTDAAINPGNSGGPLLNARGRVLGINAQIKSQSGGGEGVGFAIPVDAVRRSLRELRDRGRVAVRLPRRLHAASLWPQLADRLGIDVRDGALIQEIQTGQPGRGRGPQGRRRPDRVPGHAGADGRRRDRRGRRAAAVAQRRPGRRDQRAERRRRGHAHRAARQPAQDRAVRLGERPRGSD